MEFYIDDDLFKARGGGHKYVKRTGGPGNYEYWYKLPSGQLVSSKDDDSPKPHGKAQAEHLKRLILGKQAGHHNMSRKQMMEHTGLTDEKLEEHGHKHIFSHTPRRPHNFEPSEISEAHHATPQAHVEHLIETRTQEQAAGSPRPEHTRTPAATPTRRPRRTRADRDAAARNTAGAASAPENTGAPRSPSEERGGVPSDQQALIDKLKNEHGLDLTSPEAAGNPVAPEVVAASKQRARAAATPGSPAHRAVTQADPDFARADAPIQRATEIQADGGNPYFERSKEIFDRIKGDLKPERKAVISHVYQTLENLKTHGVPVTEASVIAEYKRISGSNIRKLSGISEEFSSGTFHSIEEIIENAPIDPEVERMKRGYAAKQMARVRPYLSSAFTSANPSAPPPYPTYADLKGWDEHGLARPASMSWPTPTGRVGGVTKAMPEEFFNAVAKGEDGKPQMPPGDLPLYLLPAWNYTVKKTIAANIKSRERGGSTTTPYSTGNFPSPVSQGAISAGNQSEQYEGIYRNAMRKYVQMRGKNEFVDIPKSNTAEIGTSHAELFKADGEENIGQTKIIDPCALQPYIEEEISGASETEKSFSLYIEDEEEYIPPYKLEQMHKSYVIEQIRRLKNDRS